MTFREDLKKTSRFMPVVLKDPDRKSVLRILIELFQLFFIHRAIPSFYFSRRLYRKSRNNIRDYLPNELLYGIAKKLNDSEAARVVSNKLYFDLFYRPHLGHLPKIIMHNHRSMFIRGAKLTAIHTSDQFERVLHEIVNEDSTTKSVFIKKTYLSYGGANTYRVSSDDFPLNKEQLLQMFDNITASAFLFQETIHQHDLLNELNPSCVNTIRMDTFIDKEGNCELGSAFLRMSLIKTHVDNVTSGGCLVGIDLESGELMEFGYPSITHTGGRILTSHPITGIAFKGFRIPFFSEAKQLALRAASLIPCLRLIGWDVAITDDGPILIEGNNGYDITANDLVFGGYKQNPVFKKVLKELELMK